MRTDSTAANQKRQTPECPDLPRLYGRKYKLRHDTGRKLKASDDDWLVVLVCRYGHVFPYGHDKLGVSVDGHPNIARSIHRLACCQTVQDGDGGELTATFHPDDFRTVARIIKPRSRRKLSAVHRAKLAASSERFRFGRNIHGSNGEQTAPISRPGQKSGSSMVSAETASLPLFAPVVAEASS